MEIRIHAHMRSGVLVKALWSRERRKANKWWGINRTCSVCIWVTRILLTHMQNQNTTTHLKRTPRLPVLLRNHSRCWKQVRVKIGLTSHLSSQSDSKRITVTAMLIGRNVKYDLCWLKCAWARWVIKYHLSRPPLTLSISLLIHIFVSPVKMGQSFPQQVIPPSEVNWPSATSRKKTGNPPPNRNMK